MTRKNFTTEETNKQNFAANEMLGNKAMNQLKGGKGTPVSTSTTSIKPTSV